MNEKLLLSRIIIGGDRKAFRKLIEFYQSPVRRFFFHLTGDRELSKDLAQETFIKIWLHIHSFRLASKFSTWLYRIAYNTFYDYLRSHKLSYDYNPDVWNDLRTNDTAEKDFDMDFIQILKVLNENERTAMLLFYMEDKTVNTISEIMNAPPGTIKSHLSRGKKKLSVFLKKEKIV